MRGHAEAPHNPPEVAYPSCLYSYKHASLVSPLECALTESPTTAHSKELTESANSFRMRSSTKTPGEGPASFHCQAPRLLQRKHISYRRLPAWLSRQDGGATKAAHPCISPLFASFCFQRLTHCPICKSIVLITLQQVPPGVGGPLLYRSLVSVLWSLLRLTARCRGSGRRRRRGRSLCPRCLRDRRGAWRRRLPGRIFPRLSACRRGRAW